MYVCMYVCMYACMYVRVYVCMYVCTCVYMYVCITQRVGAFVQQLLQYKSNKYQIFRKCVSVDLSIQRALRMCNIVICCLSGCTIFFHLFS